MLLFYVLQKSCGNKNYKPLPSTSSYTVWDLKANVASTLKCACPWCYRDWPQFGLPCNATVLLPVVYFSFVLYTSPFVEKVFQSTAAASTSVLLHTTNPLHNNPRITQLLLWTISILILRVVFLGSRTGVYEVSALQEHDAASLGDWLPVADT